MGALGLVAGAGCGDGGSTEDVAADSSTTTVIPADALAVDADLEWDAATLSDDGRTLTFHVGSMPDGDGPCEQRIAHDVVEMAESVVVGFEDRSSRPAPDDGEMCTLMATSQSFDVVLDAPLEDRPVFDGIRDGARTVHREGDLVELTYLPEGFGESLADPGSPGDGEGWWQQTFHQGDGADWYFAVNQEVGSGNDVLDGHVTDVTVNGEPAQRITGQMNDTMETIRFHLGDLTVSVWGEMQGPPTFTHSDELLRIAEGIRLPDGQ